MFNEMNCHGYEACSICLVYALLTFVDLTLRNFRGIPIILILLTNRNVTLIRVQRKSFWQL